MFRFTLICLLIAMPLAAQSGEHEKNINIGIGTYGLIITNDSQSFDDDRLSGFSISGLYAVSDIFALRAAYYALDHEDFTNIDDNGFDFVGYFGTGLLTSGFKLYGGGGYFTETWDVSGTGQSFNGFQLSGGIGYNWKNVALDLVLAVRDKSDYENVLVGTGVKVEVAGSGSLIISARF